MELKSRRERGSEIYIFVQVAKFSNPPHFLIISVPAAKSLAAAPTEIGTIVS